jgi:hypothetical protein
MDLGLVHQIPFSHPRPAPAAAANAEIRGVGIKFGERLDPSGGIKVFVKRLVNDSPAHRCGLISPGDVLVLLDGEDVYGWGLAWLRNKIPGPAGTWVRLGFRGAGGGLFEVPLCRTAYGSACTTYSCWKSGKSPSQPVVPKLTRKDGLHLAAEDAVYRKPQEQQKQRPPGQSPQV